MGNRHQPYFVRHYFRKLVAEALIRGISDRFCTTLGTRKKCKTRQQYEINYSIFLSKSPCQSDVLYLASD